MTLAPGTRLGPYEVEAPVGAGGMGEVYRARDTRLGRSVAVKVLPADVSTDPERRARFEREARAIGRLQHAHICTLFDVGAQDGTDYLVMELLDGESLAARLDRGPLAFDEVIAYGQQMARALQSAHQAGIVHRDLKPANVMITKMGVKLLDFGLARPGGGGLVDAGTLTANGAGGRPLTSPGSILGTMSYMAPEQLEGREADARSDVWSLGAVLYEMTTGRTPFEGSSAATVIGRILRDEPHPISAAQRGSPPALERLVRACLVKDPEQRWQNAGDVATALAWCGERESSPRPQPRARRLWPYGALALAAALGAATWSLGPARNAGDPAPVRRIFVRAPDGHRIATEFSPDFALGRDGSAIVYYARGATPGSWQLFHRRFDRFDAATVPGMGRWHHPFLSPDGKSVGLAREGTLSSIPLAGGTATTLAEVGSLRGASWADDGTIVFADLASGLQRVSSQGGAVTKLTELDTGGGETSHRWPLVLPGGQAVVYTVELGDRGYAHARIVARRLDGGIPRVLVEGGTYPKYSSSGHLLFARNGTLMAVRFDPEALTVDGTPAPVLEGVRGSLASGVAHYDIAADGTLVYIAGRPWESPRRIARVEPGGQWETLIPEPKLYDDVRISPDGSRLAYSVSEEGNADIWVYDLARRVGARITHQPTQEREPVWSPDGRHLAFNSSGGGASTLIVKAADGTGEERVLATGAGTPNIDSWSAQGILYTMRSPQQRLGDLWIVPERDGAPRSLLATDFDEFGATVSPDGRWLAYSSRESNTGGVYVRPFADPASRRWQVSDGQAPRWSSDGRQLFLVRNRKVMAVPVTPGADFLPGPPHVVFEDARVRPLDDFVVSYDVFPDGRSFLMLDAGEDEAPATEFRVIVGWARELSGR